MKGLFITAILGVAIVLSTNGQTQMEQRVDKLANALVDSGKVAGISILLMRDGQPLYNKAFGYANMETRTPLSRNDIFRIASQTKAITSLAAMMLWEQGKFLLDDPLSRYIPEFGHPQVLTSFNPVDSSYTSRPATREITVRDLFRHTSGITYAIFSSDGRFNAIYAKAGIGTGIGSRGTLKEQIHKLASMPLVHDPGTAFTYGLNTDILGYLVEVWSGTTLDKFMQERIFAPLEMKDTYFQVPASKAGKLVSLNRINGTRTERVTGTIYEGNDPAYPLRDGIWLSGGAGLSSTTSDYANFLQLLVNKGVYKNRRLIGERTLESMSTNQLAPGTTAKGQDPNFAFGLGWALITSDNKYLYSSPVGTIYWGGAFNTHYWADASNKIIGLVFTQEYLPASYFDLGHLFKNIVYSSINNGHE